MHQSTLPCDFALPAEWEPQSAIMLTWPHAGTDWKPYLPEITDTYLELADIITRYEQLLVATPDVPATRYQLEKKLSAEQMSRVLRSEDDWIVYGPDALGEYQLRFSSAVPAAEASRSLQAYPEVKQLKANPQCQ